MSQEEHNEFTLVRKEQFFKFLSDNQPLEQSTHRICEPVMVSYNDFSSGKIWPESMVARCWLDYDKGFPYDFEIRGES